MRKNKDLKAFMADTVIVDGEIEFEVSKRFLNDDGTPVKWTLKSLTAKEDDALRKSCTKKIASKRHKGAMVPETDINEYTGKMVAACVVYPNLNDTSLQDSYHVLGSTELLKTMLKPGEYTDLLTKVQEINGFDVSMEEMVDEVKN